MESSQSNTHAASISMNAPSITSGLPQTPQIPPPPPPQPESNQPVEDDQAESKPQVVKKGRHSDVWSFCNKVFKKNAKGVMYPWAVCNTCKHEMPAHPKHNGTTGIRNHIEKRCTNNPGYKGNVLSKDQYTITQDSMGALALLVPNTFNQKRLEEKVVRFLIRDEMPFRMVETAAFRDMISDLCPKFKIPDRKKVAAGVLDLFNVEKAKIMSFIGDQRVSITTDTWTSIQNINYMVVTAHFMDSDWKLHKRIINFTKITSHKGEDIGRCLETCLRGWGIDKVFSITVDNASANDEVVEYMSKRLKEMNTLMFDGMHLHMRCACHILKLIVKDGLTELSSSIEGIRNCVKYINSSPARLDKFREYCVLLKVVAMSNVPMDVTTRWNSTYKMLDNAAKFKLVFKRMAEENAPFVNYFSEKEGGTKRVGPPNDEDWEKADSFVHFLKKIYDSILTLSATKTATSHQLFLVLSELQIEIMEKSQVFSNLVLQKVAESMLVKFHKYWGSFEGLNKLVFVSHVLDPRYKLQAINVVFEELGADSQRISHIVSEIKKCLLNLYNEYKGEGSSSVPSSPSNSEIGLLRLELKLKRKRMEEEAAEISNEVDKYLSDPFEKLENQGFDLLDWWRVNQSWYPTLAKVAKDIFSIPSSIVASENAFSLGRRIVDPFRASLTPKMVEALVCTSDWLRAEEFNFYKEPTDDEVEFYKELEEIESTVTSSQLSTNEATPPPPTT